MTAVKMRTMGPVCQCGGSCTIFSDDFSTDQLATAYNVTSGSGTVSGGELSTTSGTFRAIANATGTTGHGKTTIQGKSSASGGSFSAIGSYVDANNYLFAELVVNGASSTFKMWKRVSGSNTQLGSTKTFAGSTGTYYTIALCWNGISATATFDGGHGIYSLYSGTGNQAGFSASPNGGTVTFNEFSFLTHINDNSSCSGQSCVADANCSTCCATPAPLAAYQINIPGNGTSAKCSSSVAVPACENIAGNYLVTETVTPCIWQFLAANMTNSVDCCGGAFATTGLVVQLRLLDPCRWRVELQLTIGDPGAGYTGCTFDEGSTTEIGANAVYLSSVFGDGECRDTKTLTKSSESSSPDVCWNFPSSLTLSPP